MKKISLLILTCFFIVGNTIALISNEMKFIQNKGQWDSNILYTSQRDGLITSVSNKGIYFDFYSKNENRIKGDVLKLNLINSKQLDFTPYEMCDEKFNYFLGNNKSNWITDVNSYKKLIAKNIYEGIDFVYYIDNNNPRYDFIVKPYANIEQIAIKFDGLQDINLVQDKVELTTTMGIIENSNLYAYQIIDGQKKSVDCQFKLEGDKVVFNISNYDNSKQLVIDPVIYSSYYGSSGDDFPSRVKFIDQQSFLIVGSTNSTDFKTTPGAYDEEYGDRTDAFITKFKIVNAEYIPQFTTYLGSLEYDEAVDLEITSSFILVTGVTESPDFPIKNAINSTHSGGKDIFVTSLSLTGDEILQSTFYGGNGDDIVVRVHKDQNNYFLFSAYSSSSDIPTVAGPLNSNYKGGYDILLFSFLPSREAVNLSAYIGGLLDDVPTDLYIDPNTDEIYLTGYTTSSKGSVNDFPIFPVKKFGFGGPYDETSNGGKDAFELVLSQNAQSIIISGFLGGDGDDIGRGIWVDENDNIYVMGETYNNSKGAYFPTTAGNKTVQGSSDLFLTKFNKMETNFGTKLQTLNYSTLISSPGGEIIRDFKKHPSLVKFNVVISSDGKFPKVDVADIKAKNDIVFSEIEPGNGEVSNAKSYGGNEDDIPVCFDFDENENYLIAGYTTSTDFPVSNNATQNKKSSKIDMVLIRNSNSKITLLTPVANEILCVGSEVKISWSGESLNLDSGYEVAYSTDENHKIFNTIVSGLMKESYLWTVPQELSGKNNLLIRVTHSSGVFDQNVAYYKVNEKATIKSFNLVTPDTICIGDSITFEAEANGTNVNYTWLKDNVEIGKTASNEFTISNANIENSGTYKVSIKNDCPPASVSQKSFYVYVSPNTKVDNLVDKITKSKGETLEITANAVGVHLNYIWQKDGNNLPAQNGKTLKLSNISLEDAGKYRCYIEGQCGIDSTNETNVIVNDKIGSVSDSYFDITKVINLSKISENIYSIVPIDISNFTVTLYNNLGSSIYKNDFNSSTELDLNNYSNGVYWLVITNKDKKYRTKLMKYN